MRTRNEDGELYGPVWLLEMLEFRFGASKTIALRGGGAGEEEP
jgi:hypothetical protein